MAIEREVKKSLNSFEILTAQMEAKKAYKARWTTSACEEQGQHLHEETNSNSKVENKKN